MNKIFCGDSLEVLKTLESESVQTCVTSPPYFGLRDYGMQGQIGLEETPEAYVEKVVQLFREVRRVLRKDGTLWLNLGDSYASTKIGNTNGTYGKVKQKAGVNEDTRKRTIPKDLKPKDLKPKDLIGIPWRVAFALQADGWYLRQDIIWSKPNPMPESVTDRCTKAHEYIFLLSKSKDYYFDHEAIKEPTVTNDNILRDRETTKLNNVPGRTKMHGLVNNNYEKRNRRSVWTVTTKPYKGAHFATFPVDLIEPCILAGTSEGGACSECGTPYERITTRPTAPTVGNSSLDRYGNGNAGVHRKVGQAYQDWLTANPKKTIGWKIGCTCKARAVNSSVVLDPFMGSGTTAAVAKKHGRQYLGIELNPEYIKLAEQRLEGVLPPQISLLSVTPH